MKKGLTFLTFIFLFGCFSSVFSQNKSGAITSETWSGTIHITGNITVSGTLTIQPGTQVIFDGAFTLKVNYGAVPRLNSQGTVSSPIRFSCPGGGGKLTNNGTMILKFCRLDKIFLESSSSAAPVPTLTFEDNILVNGGLATYGAAVAIRRNYIHQTSLSGSYALCEAPSGSDIKDNIISGGTWVTSRLGGTIHGNVIISAVVPAGGSLNNYTHEHICGVRDGAKIERNIFIGNSYGAIMAIGASNASNALIRNNTIDMRGGDAGITTHLTTPLSSNMVVRNNIFMRCRAINDEQKITDAFKYIDYNLYASVTTRYTNVVMTGKTPGSAGLDKYAQPSTGSVSPASVCTNPDFGFPFPYSDTDMLNGTVTFTQALNAYRSAYAPKSGSIAINNGDPQDSNDPLVQDQRCDIGAIEGTGAPYNPGPTISSVTPANAATGIAETTSISFDLSDVDSVNTSTLAVTVNGTNVKASCQISAVGSGIHVSYKPSTGFSSGSTVNVSVVAYDKKGNQNSQAWSFTIKAAPNPGPVFSSLTPANNATGIIETTAVSFNVTDADTINTSNLAVTVNGTNVKASCQISNISSGIHVSYKPFTPFASGSTVNVSVVAYDKKGSQTSQAWSFIIRTIPPSSLSAQPALNRIMSLESFQKSGNQVNFNIQLPVAGAFGLGVYDIWGKTLWETHGVARGNAEYKITWENSGIHGSGIYWVRLISGQKELNKKFMMLP